MSVRLVGRTHEVATIEAEWSRAAAGEFRCVLVVGEPGVGKTRLTAEALRGRRPAPVVLSARGHSLGGAAAFGLWAEALERHLRIVPPAEVDRLWTGLVDDLSGLVLSIAARRPRRCDPDVPRTRLLEALAELLRPYGVVELVRTGRVAIPRGTKEPRLKPVTRKAIS